MEFWKNVLPLLEYLTGLAVVAVNIWPKKSSKKLRLAFSFLFITTTCLLLIIFLFSMLWDTKNDEQQIKATATMPAKSLYIIQRPSGYSKEAALNDIMRAIQKNVNQTGEINTFSILLIITEKHGNILILTANQFSQQWKGDSIFYLSLEEFCNRVKTYQIKAVLPVTEVTDQLSEAKMVAIIR